MDNDSGDDETDELRQLLASFHQRHPNHYSSHPTHLATSIPSSPLSPFITPTLFHSKLKTYLSHKSFPSQVLHIGQFSQTKDRSTVCLFSKFSSSSLLVHYIW